MRIVRPRWRPWVVTALLAMAWPVHAALVLQLEPSTGTHAQGETFGIDLVMSGLSGFDPAQVLSTFDLTLTFDPALLQIAADPLESNALCDQAADGPNCQGLSSLFIYTPPDAGTPNQFSLFNLSFASDEQLDAQQGDSVTLVSMSFLGLAPGDAQLGFSLSPAPVLGGRLDPQTQTVTNLLQFDVTFVGATATITPRAVPEPGSLALLAAGLLLLGSQVARRQR